jgi:hypothetical protein
VRVVLAFGVALLVQDEAAHVVPQDDDGAYRVLRVEPRLDQHAQGALDARPAVGGGPVAGGEPRAVSVGQHRAAAYPHPLGQPLVPGLAGPGPPAGAALGAFAGDGGEVVEKVLLAGEVPVQGRCLDAELLGQPS